LVTRLVGDLLDRWQQAERQRRGLTRGSLEYAPAEAECEALADRYRAAVRRWEAVEGYLIARQARARAVPGDHAWANAQMAVRFWRRELAGLPVT
jgi:hypothetical protein